MLLNYHHVNLAKYIKIGYSNLHTMTTQTADIDRLLLQPN